eukprot:CAMPEP_0196572382 /NCGR_PEP_ID=MMETSP1081-20130531/2448_1 /TAXON_ID=36882 /ORGANISM="Pyramimonas amylifera, Strain CCMP720" /LENGTH=140 /DNA_ID=CAMNT_0041889689 /DNA_START=221 /DNA_END=643 /DNA_ORIENTATION=+
MYWALEGHGAPPLAPKQDRAEADEPRDGQHQELGDVGGSWLNPFVRIALPKGEGWNKRGAMYEGQSYKSVPASEEESFGVGPHVDALLHPAWDQDAYPSSFEMARHAFPGCRSQSHPRPEVPDSRHVEYRGSGEGSFAAR